MKLNPDCIRDILMYVESISDGVTGVLISNHSPDIFNENEYLSSYTNEEIYYHFQQANYSDLLIGYKSYVDGGYSFRDLSPKGHKFLANIRSNKIWNKTKEKAEEIGSMSLEVLLKIASTLMFNAITT